MDTKNSTTPTHSPLPWSITLYNKDAPGDYKPAEVLDANCLPVGYFTHNMAHADAALIVEAVNAHASQSARIAELEGALRKVSDRLECAVSDAPAHVRAAWQTDVDAARALLGKGG